MDNKEKGMKKSFSDIMSKLSIALLPPEEKETDEETISHEAEEEQVDDIDEVKTVEGNAEEIADEVKPIKDNIEEVADEVKPVEDNAEEVADEVKPIKDNIEQVADEVKPVEDNAEKVANEVKTIEDKTDSDIEKKIAEIREKKHKSFKINSQKIKNTAKKTISTINTALDEDEEEIEELSEPPVEEIDEETNTHAKQRNFKRRIYFIVGLTVTVMSLIGFIFSIGFVVNEVRRFTDNTAQKEEFASYIYPIALVDMSAFDEVSDLTSEQITTAAVWDLIMSDNLDKYQQTLDVISVPSTDIEAHAAKLFGSDVKIEHKSYSSTSIQYYYDKSTKNYNIPVSPSYYSYIPEIEDISKSGDIYTVIAGYKKDSPSWQKQRSDYEGNISKYMELTIKKDGNTYKIISMKNVSSRYKNVGN